MANVDPDRPSTWVKYREGLCDSCLSVCCMLPVEVKASDLVRLGLAGEDEVQRSKKKLFKRLKKEKILASYREGTDLFMLQPNARGECLFLDPHTRRCRVYEKRPEVCRDFPTRVGPRVGYCPSQKK